MLFILLIVLGGQLELILPIGLAISFIGLLLIWIPNRTPKLLLLSAICLALALHLVDGFNNAKIFSSHSFGVSQLPFQLYANVDKSIAALLLLLAFGRQEKWRISAEAIKWLGLTTCAFFALAILMGAKLEFKLSELTLVFAVLNLVTTCVAEESFFRLVIQKELSRLSFTQGRSWLIVLITAAVFTLAHIHFFSDYEKRLFLIFVAGALYSLAYLRFNLGTAIALHYLINLIHFICFAYPAAFS